MGFTNVAWESRSAEQLARDLTDGPGPMSVGQSGAAWVRIADELSSISADYDKVVDRIKGSFAGQGADAAARRLDEFGQWLRAVSLSAAGNGERAESASVAYSVAVLAMPSVSEAIEAKTAQEAMASLAAYNGAILNGQFAEFDQSATDGQATASAVMYSYEQACDELSAPWDQPAAPDVSNGAALKAEQNAKAAGANTGAGDGRSDRRASGVGAAGVVPTPLAQFRASEVKSSGDSKAVDKTGSSGGGSGSGFVGGGYGPMAGLARSTASDSEHETTMSAGTLEGGGEPGAHLSATDASWLPAAGPNEAPYLVSDVSWGQSTSVFDDLAVPDQPDTPTYADVPQPTLEQVSDRWVSPPVIGADKAPTL